MNSSLTGSLVADIELLLAIALLLCGYVYLVMRKPLIGFVCFIFLVLTRLHEYIPHSEMFRISVAVGVLMMLGLFLFLWTTRSPIFFDSPQSFILGLYVVINFVSLFVKGQTYYDYHGNPILEALLLVFTIYFATINTMRQRSDFQVVLKAFIFIGLTIALLASIQSFVTGSFFGLGRSWTYEGTNTTVIRAGSLGIDPNGVAITLAAFLPLLYFCLNNANTGSILKLFHYFSFFLFIMTIFLTYSRIGFACLLAVLYLILKQKINLNKLIVLIAVLMIVIVGLPGEFWERILGIGTMDTTGSGRLFIFQTALQMILASPLTGIGYGQFYYFYDEYSQQSWYHHISPHNTYLGIAAETGLINLFVFFWLVVLTFVDLRRLKTEASHESDYYSFQLAEALSSSLKIALIAGLTLDCRSWVPFYIFLGLAVALRRISVIARKTIPVAMKRNKFVYQA